MLFLLLLLKPQHTLSSTSCRQPTLHLQMDEAPLAPMGTSKYIFQVQTEGGGLQFCKMVCRNGTWRGPICAEDKDLIKDSLFNFPCSLLYVPHNLEVYHHHTIIKVGKQFPSGTVLRSRCKT